METIWLEIKNALKATIPSHCYRMWIDPIVFTGMDGEDMVVSCPNPFSRRRIVEQYARRIEAELLRISGHPGSLKIVLHNREQQSTSDPFVDPQLPLPNMTIQPHSGRFLKREFTFDQFVVGGNNDFAYSAALSLAAQKQSDQNALFILSKTGLGKSHLSQAVGHHILAERPAEKVYYITAEDFTNEMIDSFRNNTVGSFKNKYQNQCDVLLIEDVHHLSGKDRTQIELAQTIDALFNSGKKLIFSSCCLPKDIPKMNDQLRSRFSCGIVSNIEAPDYRTRLRILKKKATNNGYRMPDEILQYLASELTEDVRQLTSGLMGVATKASLLGASINLQLAEGVVENIARKNKAITIDLIKMLVSKHFNVTISDLVSKSRKQAVVRPRQVAIFLSRKYTDQPLQAIGKSFNRYHATALHAIGTVEKGMKNNGAIQKQVEFLSNKIEKGDF